MSQKIEKLDAFKSIINDYKSETFTIEFSFTVKELVKRLKELKVDNDLKIGFNNISYYIFKKYKIKVGNKNRIYMMCAPDDKKCKVGSWLIEDKKSYDNLINEFIDDILEIDYILDDYYTLADGMGYGMNMVSWEISGTDGLRYSEYQIDENQHVTLKIGFIDLEDCYVKCVDKIM